MLLHYVQIERGCGLSIPVDPKTKMDEHKLWSLAVQRHKRWVYENDSDPAQIHERSNRKIECICSVDTSDPDNTRQVLIDKRNGKGN